MPLNTLGHVKQGWYSYREGSWKFLKSPRVLPRPNCSHPVCSESSSLNTLTTHTHSRLTALCPGLPGWASTRKVKSIWILWKQETVSGSGISWAICKSAPHSRQPCQHPTTQFFTGRMPFLLPNQQRQSTEGMKGSWKFLKSPWVPPHPNCVCPVCSESSSLNTLTAAKHS